MTKSADAPKPQEERKRGRGEKEKGTPPQAFRLAAKTVIRRVRNRAAQTARIIFSKTFADAFTQAAQIIGDQAENFFPDIDAPASDAIDAANPYWDFSLDDSSSTFEIVSDNTGLPSLEL